MKSKELQALQCFGWAAFQSKALKRRIIAAADGVNSRICWYGTLEMMESFSN
jgi:hypothetical protein